MADRYNFEAERPADVDVTQTPAVRDDQWGIVAERIVNPIRHEGYQAIPTQLPIPPRVIRLSLESESAVELTATTCTWVLNFPAVGSLAPNTVLIWRDAYVSVGSQASNGFIELGLIGFTAHSYSTNSGSPYVFRSGVTIRTVVPSCLELTGTAPLACTLTGTNCLMNRRITLERLGGWGNTWVGGTIRVGLMFVEPGARIM